MRPILDTALINHSGERFEVKGPLGRGLMVKPKGVHIVFAAGTGVLCFVDLVAQLALAIMDLDTAIL
jgi:NAD(P)H-flavin reductase